MTATGQEKTFRPDATVTNHASESGRWLKLMADIEHEPEPQPEVAGPFVVPRFESTPAYGLGAPGFPFLPRPGSLEL
jgi:hypothetical protein